MKITRMFRTAALGLSAAVASLTVATGQALSDCVPIFITIGQSNADGSAYFDASLDEALNEWYSSTANNGKMKIWYRSCQVANQSANALGEAARWVVDGTTTDVEPGWLNLWYRNENTSGRTAMNMIHGYGTYSIGTGTDCAQGRRGMEGAFGKAFCTALPDEELYVLKLGASGSFISSWANPADDTNWHYFYDNIFRPAVADILSKGKRPRLAGIWWMQGCADRNATQAYYQECLERLVDRVEKELGFADGRIYVGHIVKAGESDVNPDGSVQFGQGVRDAQDAVAEAHENVTVVDTKDFPMQYESSFGGTLHFNHEGVNAIGEELASRVVAEGKDGWAEFSTPGTWRQTNDGAVFTPSVGNPEISYAKDGTTVTATLTYPGFTETKSYVMSDIAPIGPGYLDCDGTRYMYIPHSADFDIAAGGSMTVSARVLLNDYGQHRGIVSNRWHSATTSSAGNGSATGFDIYGGNSSTQSMSNNVNLNKGSWNNLGHPWCNTLGTGEWATVTWVLDGAAGTSKMYLNGELKDTRTNADIKNYAINPQGDMLVGARYNLSAYPCAVNTGECWIGKIDDVRFYSRALSAEEVAADIASAEALTEGLIAAYDFTTLSGTRVPDVSGNGHDGVLVNFPDYGAAPDPNALEKVLVYDMNEDGSKYYRIPALVTAADGSLVALADKRGESLSDLPNTISVVAKRSTDGGQTWSPAVTIAEGNSSTGKTYGDPAVVLDRNTGNLVAVFSGDTGFFVSNKSNRAGFYVSVSSDNGVTWSEPRSITDQVYQSNWYGAFAASGSMLQTSDGTIMFVANTRLSSAQYVVDVYEFVCASTDGGTTWSVLNADSRIPAAGDGNESKLVETSDGTLIMSIRSSGTRRFAKSTDGGRTWTAANYVAGLTEPGCNGDIIVYPSTDGQTRMLHSLPSNSSVRRDVSIYLSYDEGETWPVKKKLIDGVSAYSSLTVLDDGMIGCLVEEGKWDSNIAGEDGFRLYFMKFDLDWLTDGADVSDPNDVFDGTLNCDGTRYMYIDHSTDFDIAAGGSMTVSAKVLLNDYGQHRGIVSNRWHSATTSSAGNGSATGFDIYGGNSSTQSMSNNVNLNKGSWNNLGHPWCNTLGTGEWATVTWVLDGTAGTSKMYLNGELKDTRTNADIKNYAINPQGDMLVGARYNLSAYPCAVNTGECWIGKIDDVRFYSRALSADEVVAEMSSTVGASTPDLIAAYDFSEIIGDKVTDISGNGHTGTLVGFPDNNPGYKLNITAPLAKEGTLEVFNGTTAVVNGRNVAEGTELTIVATPAKNYLLTGLYVNGDKIEGNTFVMSEATTVSATFERDPEAPLEYCAPTGNATRSDARGINSLTVTDDNGSSVEVTGAGNTADHALYTDATQTVLVTSPGASITIKNNGDGKWMSSYVYVDYDRNGVFDLDASACVGANVNGELVAHTGYSGTSANPSVASDGVAVTDNVASSKYDWQRSFEITLPTFTLPADLAPGDYRVRHKMDWNCVDPCGRMSENGFTDNFMDANGGGIIDFIIRIPSPERTLEMSVSGEGSIEAWTSRTGTLEPAGVQVASGETIPGDASGLYFWFKPAEGNEFESAAVMIGEDEQTVVATNDGNGNYLWQLGVADITGDLMVSAVFAPITLGIDGIGVDLTSGPVEIYTVGGVKVTSRTLTPGFYIIRQNGKSRKVWLSGPVAK